MPDQYTINLSVSPNFQSPANIIYVNKNSNATHRKQLEKLARYFKKEFSYDFIQYEANENSNECSEYSGFLFVDEAWDKLVEDHPLPYRIYGGGCFRWQEWTDYEPSWSLDWIWLHPFFRNRGNLHQYWDQFEQIFGKFHISQPTSPSMKKFIERKNYEPRLIKRIEQ